MVTRMPQRADIETVLTTDSQLSLAEDNEISTNKVSEQFPITELLTEKLKLCYDSRKGQGLVARKDISINESIYSMPYPSMTAIESGKLDTTCYSCLIVTSINKPYLSHGVALTELKKCTGCGQVRFCNKECQKEAWNNFHKYECKIFRKYQNNFPPMFVRASLRVVLLRDRGLLKEDDWDRLINLESHPEIWQNSGRNNLTHMIEGIKLVSKTSMSLETVTMLFWIMRTNQIELPTQVSGGIGIMVDPILSKINHSCFPNATLYRPNHTSSTNWMNSTQLSVEERNTFSMIVPVRPISEGDEITISCSDSTMSVQERNAKHKRNYYFECNCRKCQDDLSSTMELQMTFPALTTEYTIWSKDVLRQVTEIDGCKTRFEAAAIAVDNIQQYLDYPGLITTGALPETLRLLALIVLDQAALDVTILNLLRFHFLIAPTRYSGELNPVNPDMTLMFLETVDVLLGLRKSDFSRGNAKQSILGLSRRGMSICSLFYWRNRICAHLRKRLEQSAARDLLGLVAVFEARVEDVDGGKLSNLDHDVASDMEQTMRKVLQLSEARWETVLELAGC